MAVSNIDETLAETNAEKPAEEKADDKPVHQRLFERHDVPEAAPETAPEAASETAEPAPAEPAEITITAGENVEAFNRGVLEIRSPERPNPILVPLTILG